MNRNALNRHRLENSVAETPSLFSRIIAGEIPAAFVAKGPDWVAFLDINPRREGHTLVVPHEQAKRISSLSKEQLTSLMSGVIEVQRRLGKHFSTEDFSVVIHDGPRAGQEIPHVHIHVIPRNPGDGGRSLLAMWPKSPPIGSLDPDYARLAELSEQLKKSS